MSHVETLNITRDRGETYPINLALIEKSTKGPLDISEGTLTLTASTKKSPSAGFASSFSSIGNVTDGIGGKVSFPMNTSQQSDNVGTFYYDVEWDKNGELRTVLKGIISFVQDITK